MARAYIALARNDLHDNLLQVLDLVPNTSQMRGTRVHVPGEGGQTTYLSQLVQNQGCHSTDPGDGSRTMDADTYGLAAYILDNVADVGGGGSAGGGSVGAVEDALSDFDAGRIAGLILARVAAGATLTAAALNTLVSDYLGGDDSDFDGSGGTNSRGVVAELLRIVSGEVYLLEAGDTVADAGGVFPAARSGYFATTPNVENDNYSIRTGADDRGARGRNPFTTPPVPPLAPTQTPPEDVNFRHIRQIEDTGDLHRSALDGALSKLAVATFSFENPLFTYGTAGTALFVDGDHVPATFVGRAVTVYDAVGNVI